MQKKYNKHGIIGSIVFHAIILILLMVFGLTTLPQQEEGILVNLGNVETGLGEVEPPKSSSTPTPVQPKTTPPPPTPKEKSAPKTEENIKTQDYDKAPEIKSAEQKKKEEAEKIRKIQEEKERKAKEEKERLEQEEADRIAKEKADAERKAEEERKRIEEEQRKKREEEQRIADEARNKVGSAFGKSNSNSSSEGDAGGSGNQGYVTGDPNSKNRSGSGLGNSGSGFDLTGRSLVGSLPQPSYGIQEEGIVVVQVTVDKYGKVVSAVYQLKGSTTQNSTLKAAAIAAAKKAKFNSDPNAAAFQKGTITYHFVLN
ncbi:TonB family protein [Plebeiibacterium marinum]|uniref:TonB family protein n=1 Tax=Plebeiibacterium marinum TaxID=2992111 RepID=A0AAE3SJU9_9BACT|nr:TonB family protein [Plebeiobacterium marinum]MCW3805987.1 TonB family protein [Plebeiobacterium marinum]